MTTPKIQRTNKEINIMVAKALGWRYGTHRMARGGMKGWFNEKDIPMRSLPDFSTKVQEAIDYIVPELMKEPLYLSGEFWFVLAPEGHVRCCLRDMPHVSSKEDFTNVYGEGFFISEKIAWALCEVLLKVKVKANVVSSERSEQ